MSAPDAPPTPPCDVHAYAKPATVRYRLLPRRGLDNPPAAVRRATAWPGQAEPVDVFACGDQKCADLVRSLATAILAKEALDGEAVVRTVSP